MLTHLLTTNPAVFWCSDRMVLVTAPMIMTQPHQMLEARDTHGDPDHIPETNQETVTVQ